MAASRDVNETVKPDSLILFMKRSCSNPTSANGAILDLDKRGKKALDRPCVNMSQYSNEEITIILYYNIIICNVIHQKRTPLQNCFGFVDGTVLRISRPKINQNIAQNGHKRASKFGST